MNDPSPRQLVAAATREIVHNVRTTHYQHEPIVIDPQTGTYELDCSEFVSHVLRNVTPMQYRELPRVVGQPCPRAFEYFGFFSTLAPNGADGWERTYPIDGATAIETIVGWRPIARVFDVRPGDVIAWLHKGWVPGENTGHTMVVAAPPVALEHGVAAVRVHDACAAPHFDDSRVKGGVFGSGVGTGTVHLHLDATGAPTRFRFGPNDPVTAAPIAMGRVTR